MSGIVEELIDDEKKESALLQQQPLRICLTCSKLAIVFRMYAFRKNGFE